MDVPLQAAADEPLVALVADVALVTLGVEADDKLAPCCHAGALLFSCNYYCGSNVNYN